MILGEIAVGTVDNSKYDYIYESIICMSELFSRLIYKYKWHTPARKVIIWIREDYTFYNRLAGGIYEEEVIFEFDHLLSLENLERRKYLIKLIVTSLMHFSKKYDLNIEPIIKTNNECEELGYLNIWILGDKRYVSPSKHNKVEVQCDWQEEFLFVNLLVFNKQNVLIHKIDWFSLESRVGYKIYEYKGQFIDDFTFIFSNKYYYQKWKIDLKKYLN